MSHLYKHRTTALNGIYAWCSHNTKFHNKQLDDLIIEFSKDVFVGFELKGHQSRKVDIIAKILHRNNVFYLFTDWVVMKYPNRIDPSYILKQKK